MVPLTKVSYFTKFFIARKQARRGKLSRQNLGRDNRGLREPRLIGVRIDGVLSDYVQKLSFGQSNVDSIYGPEGNLASTKRNRRLHDSFQMDSFGNVAT
jgi:hypothetical protein